MKSSKELIRKLLLRFNLYYLYLDSKFYQLGNNKNQKDFYSSLVEKDSLVFDVGANIGQRSKIFSDLSKQVIAFEPQKNCIAHLKSRFKYNSKVIIEEIGLGAKSRKEKMFISDTSVISTFSKNHREQFSKNVFKDSNWTHEEWMDIKTLDWAIKKYGKPNFIKIDVEGYEVQVLKGLSTSIHNISFEFTPYANLMNDTISCIKILCQLNSMYKFNFTLGENLKFQLSEFVSGEDLICHTDFLNASSFGDVYAKLFENL